MGKDDMYLLLDVTEKKQVNDARSDLKRRVKAEPDKKFFIAMAFACHGHMMDGK